LRQSGFTVRKTIDCLIATFCLEAGHSLLHRDRDFDPFEKYLGLQVVHP
jgi:predicted nucleic acid-binding protein